MGLIIVLEFFINFLFEIRS